jgi:hypothetical protein
MNTLPKKGFYRHYKYDPAGPVNNYTYEVIGVALHTEERDHTVIYRPLYQNTFLGEADFCARPLDMFIGQVEKDGVMVNRFTLITDNSVIRELLKKSK